jgi:tetratricopeptide (TPR) repeat protein
MDRLEEAIDRYRVAVALRFDNNDARRALAALLADAGNVQAAAHELEAVLTLAPFENETRLRLAELHAANGRLDDGLRLFAAARELSPDEPEVHERAARALLQAGRREEALAAFERALALRPQNPSLREALRALQGANASYGVEHAYEVAPLIKEADSYAGEDAVYLVDYQYTRVQPTGLSSRFHQVAVKVFTQRGADAFRTFPITYSPDRQEVQVLKVRITKPDGSVVESFGDADRNMNEPWSGMYYDARARELSFPSLTPGDVIELQYRLEDTARDNLLADYWGDVDYVQSTAAKLRYRYMVDMPASRPLYWNRAQLPPGITARQTPTEDGRVLYAWEASRVARVVPEPGMPGWAEVAATLHVSTYKTWDDVGRYWWGLVRDQLTPNDELRRTTEEALKGVNRADALAVVRAIYNFVVTNTRYVALEFGIHGYKPYRVDRVLARRFGDCKDKASLIHAMLKVAGVDSRLVLLRMRHLGQLPPEPASLAAFNHAIVYVPKFDLYLDGTASFHAASELPSADRVANILIVDPDGKSTFMTTPEGSARDNATEVALDVTLREDGSAEAGGRTRVSGVQAPEYRRAYEAAATRKATFEQGWAQTFPGLRVARVAVNDVGRLDEAVQVGFEMEIPRYAEATSGGLRFHPFGAGRTYTQAFAPLAERQHDLLMNAPWSSSFAFRYTLPAGYQVREMPPEVNETTPFGSLRMAHRMERGKLVSEGELVISTARVSAKDYPAFRAFLGRVDQAFARKVVVAPARIQASAP